MPSQRIQKAKPSSNAELMKEKRTEQLGQITEVINALEKRREKLKEQLRQLALLESVSHGLYDEVDKLTKKAPAETITDLALEQVNDVIRETKELLENDVYIQRLNIFVPAGDNPQHRDVVIVLRQVRQGLDRFRKQIDPLSDRLRSWINEAKTIEVAINSYLSGKVRIEQEEFPDFHVYASDVWLTGNFPKVFNFNRLENTNIAEYFSGAMQE